MRSGRASAWCCLTAALLLWLLSGCAAKHSIPIASGVDLASTEYFLRHTGLQEGQPLAPSSTAGRVAVKAAGTAVLVLICDELDRRGHHKAARFLQWTATGVFAGAAGWNVCLVLEAR